MSSGELTVGDRVRWLWREPTATWAELHGKITSILPNGEVTVRWDDGSEEGCELSDLEPEPRSDRE
jgi:hypothetical protein